MLEFVLSKLLTKKYLLLGVLEKLIKQESYNYELLLNINNGILF